eukprot:387678-Lingulodinium_polyedra.AAC.1
MLWHKEVWGVLVRPRGRARGLTIGELVECWEQVGHRVPKNAGGVRGPVSAAWLAFRQIGWAWASLFVLQRDDGQYLILSKFAPKLV